MIVWSAVVNDVNALVFWLGQSTVHHMDCNASHSNTGFQHTEFNAQDEYLYMLYNDGELPFFASTPLHVVLLNFIWHLITCKIVACFFSDSSKARYEQLSWQHTLIRINDYCLNWNMIRKGRSESVA